jgi:uncharacterized metal-binding protein
MKKTVTSTFKITKFNRNQCKNNNKNSILILLDSCPQTCMTYTIAECTVNNS